MNGQLAFDLGQKDGFLRDDFFPSASNRAALAMVDGWQGWPSGRMLLIGPQGAGKTHLAHIWVGMSGAQMVPAMNAPSMSVRRWWQEAQRPRCWQVKARRNSWSQSGQWKRVKPAWRSPQRRTATMALVAAVR